MPTEEKEPTLPNSSAQARTDAGSATSETDVTRGQTARQLLTTEQWLESIAFTPLLSLRISGIAGFQSALAVLIAIVITHFSPWPHLVGYPEIGRAHV